MWCWLSRCWTPRWRRRWGRWVQGQGGQAGQQPEHGQLGAPAHRLRPGLAPPCAARLSLAPRARRRWGGWIASARRAPRTCTGEAGAGACRLEGPGRTLPRLALPRLPRTLRLRSARQRPSFKGLHCMLSRPPHPSPPNPPTRQLCGGAHDRGERACAEPAARRRHGPGGRVGWVGVGAARAVWAVWAEVRAGPHASALAAQLAAVEVSRPRLHLSLRPPAAARSPARSAVKRAAGGKEAGALTVRDVALLLRQPQEEGLEEEPEEEEPGAAAALGQADGAAAVSPRQRAAAAAAARMAASAGLS